MENSFRFIILFINIKYLLFAGNVVLLTHSCILWTFYEDYVYCMCVTVFKNNVECRLVSENCGAFFKAKEHPSIFFVEREKINKEKKRKTFLSFRLSFPQGTCKSSSEEAWLPNCTWIFL